MNKTTDRQELNGSRTKIGKVKANQPQLIKGLPPRVQLAR